MTGYRVANEQAGMHYRDVWTTAYVNDLPDSAFLLITPGGTKTGGRTDGAHRFFPYRDATGKIDLPHLKNAGARIPQASSLTADQRAEAMAKYKKLAAAHPGIGDGTTSSYQGTAGSGRSWLPASDRIEERAMTVPLELRGIDGRTIVGRAVPWDEVADIGGRFREVFRRGAFEAQLAGGQLHRVHLFGAHKDRLDGRLPLARTASLTDEPSGLFGEWPVPKTSAGDDALALVRDGVVSGLSVGFRSLNRGSRKTGDGIVERVAAHLDHVTLCTEPAYASAGVLAVRTRSYDTAAVTERHRRQTEAWPALP